MPKEDTCMKLTDLLQMRTTHSAAPAQRVSVEPGTTTSCLLGGGGGGSGSSGGGRVRGTQQGGLTAGGGVVRGGRLHWQGWRTQPCHVAGGRLVRLLREVVVVVVVLLNTQSRYSSMDTSYSLILNTIMPDLLMLKQKLCQIASHFLTRNRPLFELES